MYLYVPVDGRSVIVGEYTISSTGMQFEEPVQCLEEAVGPILKRMEEWLNDTPPKPLYAPASKSEATPETTEI